MRWVLLTAMATGIISSFYHLIPGLNTPYTPLTLNDQAPSFAVDETFFYAPRVNQPLTEPGEVVGSSLMAWLAALSGSTVNAFILADLIFPPLVFLILFRLIKLWLKSNIQAVTGGLAVMIGYHYLTYFPYLPSVLKLFLSYWQKGDYWQFIRSFHPQISLGLFLLFAFHLRPGAKTKWWLISLLLVLLTYTHFFYWTAALTWLVWLGINRRLVKILALWGFLTLPYWLSLWRWLPALDYWQRNYFYQPPAPTQWLLLVLGVILSADKFWRRFYAAAFTLVIAAMLLRFGVDDPIGHWFLRVIHPMTAILLIITIFKKISLPKALWLAVSLLLLTFQWRLHSQYFKNNAAAFTVEPERLEAFVWLKDNTPKNSIVAAGMKDSLYLPAYTNNQPYLKQSQLSRADNQELVQRFLEVNKISGTAEDELASMFTDNQELKSKKRFDFDACAGHFLFFRLYAGADYYSCTVPKTVLDEILEQYAQTPSRLAYPAGYWLGQTQIDFGRLIWENQNYKIYALNNN